MFTESPIFDAEAQSKSGRDAEEFPVSASAELSSTLCASASKNDAAPLRNGLSVHTLSEDVPKARSGLCANGATHTSPRQRPMKREEYNQGLKARTQGVALGWYEYGPLALTRDFQYTLSEKH